MPQREEELLAEIARLNRHAETMRGLFAEAERDVTEQRQRAEAAEDENRRLREENAQLKRESIGYRAYHQQIGDLP